MILNTFVVILLLKSPSFFALGEGEPLNYGSGT